MKKKQRKLEKKKKIIPKNLANLLFIDNPF